jgi:hypothetical protein
MSERPTETASAHYESAKQLFNMLFGMAGRNELEMKNFHAGLSRALSMHCDGDQAMATALRAIYIKLDEIDRKLAARR